MCRVVLVDLIVFVKPRHYRRKPQQALPACPNSAQRQALDDELAMAAGSRHCERCEFCPLISPPCSYSAFPLPVAAVFTAYFSLVHFVIT